LLLCPTSLVAYIHSAGLCPTLFNLESGIVSIKEIRQAPLLEFTNTWIMHTNKIFVRTTKAEREGSRISNNLTRMLSHMDGKSTSDELAKRAPPSLRKIWDELIVQLVNGGYIVENPATAADRKSAPRDLTPDQKEQITAHTPAAQGAAVQAPLDPEAKLNAEKAARAAELKAYFAAAKEKAKAEAKQAAHDDAEAHAKLEAAAAAAKASADAEAKAKAAAKQREEEAAQARAKLEAAAAAAKASSDAEAKAKAEAIQRDEKAALARADLDAAIIATKIRAELGAKASSDAEANAKAEARQTDKIAAQARAELESASAAAKASAEAEAKAKAEAKQRDEKAARAQAELEAAVDAAKVRSDALAMAKAEAKQRDEEAARTRAELEAANLAAKFGGGAAAKAGISANQDEGAGMYFANAGTAHSAPAQAGTVDLITTNETVRLQNLEIENEALKKLLADAYVEIAMLKTSLGIKQ
jgi:hypothetical protein